MDDHALIATLRAQCARDAESLSRSRPGRRALRKWMARVVARRHHMSDRLRKLAALEAKIAAGAA